MSEPTERQQKPQAVPAIYECIRDTVSTERLIQQIMQDWFGEHDGEKLFLGLSGLLQREDAYGAIRYLQTDTSGLGELLKKLPEDLRISGPNLEELVGLQRMPHMRDEYRAYETYSRQERDAMIQHHLAEIIQSGELPPGSTEYDLDDFYRREANRDQAYIDQMRTQGDTAFRTIRPDEILTGYATFGAEEPTYLELLGPLNILRLREMATPTLLLVGAQYPETVVEFSQFIYTLNPQARGVIMDSHPMAHQMFTDLGTTIPNVTYRPGNVLFDDLPPDSIDVAFTNHLFKNLRDQNYVCMDQDLHTDSTETIGRFMQKIASALRSGGQLLTLELPYPHPRARTPKPYSVRQAEIQKFGRQQGLHATTLPNKYKYEFRKDIGSARLSPNGLPYYNNALIVRNHQLATVIRLSKPL